MSGGPWRYSPYVGKLTTDWSGREVTLRFAEPLRERTTYVVSVGTDVVDLRGKNRMASGFTLAFSTGDSIDQGFVAGRVLDEKPEGVMIFAYRLESTAADTLVPSADEPDYITQSGTGGTFTLANMAAGAYRVLAVRDEFRNLLYDRQVDAYACAPSDLVLDERQMRVSDLWFRLAVEDTAGPFLSGVQTVDGSTVRSPLQRAAGHHGHRGLDASRGRLAAVHLFRLGFGIAQERKRSFDDIWQ